MNQKTIKIPQGQIKVLFENNGQSFEITDKILWTALCDNMFKRIDEDAPKPTGRPDFDDENPDFIRQSQEEI